MTRRDFSAATTLAAATATTAASAQSPRPKRRGNIHEFAPGLKIALQSGSDPSDDDLTFVKQLGLDWVTLNTSGAGGTLENFKRLKAKVDAAGLNVWNIGNANVHNMEEVTLNLPGRDQKIEEYKQFLRNLAATGVFYTTYAHMGNGIWSTGREISRHSSGRAFDLAKATDSGQWNGKKFSMPLSHGRRFTEKEMWDNYTHWVNQAVPVAEEVGVRIGIHPDDPPGLKELAGVPRCIFGNFAGYKRALEIADSDNVGVCLCCGCWLEGGDAMGADVLTAIRYFAERNKLWKIHFRNTDKPLPHFIETHLDGGYMKMYSIMKTLVEVGFRGAVIVDHVPTMVGGPKVAWAYNIAYAKALLERAHDEVKRPAGSLR
jgi:mannonate dehydratase